MEIKPVDVAELLVQEKINLDNSKADVIDSEQKNSAALINLDSLDEEPTLPEEASVMEKAGGKKLDAIRKNVQGGNAQQLTNGAKPRALKVTTTDKNGVKIKSAYIISADGRYTKISQNTKTGRVSVSNSNQDTQIETIRTTKNKETGETVKEGLNAEGKIVKDTVTTKDGSEKKSVYKYASDGKYEKLTKDEALKILIKAAYDEKGRILKEVKKNKSGVFEYSQYEYNKDGSCTQTIKNSNTGVIEVITFDKNGVKLQKVTTDKDGNKKTTTYNADGTVKAEK